MSTSKFSSNEILTQFERVKPSKSVFGNFRIDGKLLVYKSATTQDLNVRWSNASEFQIARKKLGEKIRELDARIINKESGKEVMLEGLKYSDDYSSLAFQGFETNLIAVKVEHNGETILLGNSDTLDLVGRRMAYGNDQRNQNFTDIQLGMAQRKYLLLPLTRVYNEVSDSIGSLEVLEKGPMLHFSTTEHVSGGNRWSRKEVNVTRAQAPLLFRVNKKVYLSDLDRRDYRYSRVNEFISPVSASINTINDAYESLKPKEVVEAESKGVDVKRIGKFYAVKSEAPTIPKLTLNEILTVFAEKTGNYDLSEHVVRYLTESAGESVNPKGKKHAEILLKVPRAMDVSGYKTSQCIVVDGEVYVTGTVSQSGRATLDLGNSWYRVAFKHGTLVELEGED